MASEESYPLQGVIEQLDAETRSRISRAFPRFLEFVSRPGAAEVLVPEVQRVLATSNPNTSDFAQRLGIGEDAAEDLQAAGTFLIGLAGRTESNDEIVAGVTRSGIIPENSAESVTSFLSGVRRPDLARFMRASRVADRTLPSYKNFSSSVDVRLDFTAGSVDLAVPVLVAVIATDQDQERTWFQMNRDQLSDLVKILQGRLRQMDLAEEWIRARPSGAK
jgi:hypothetical protein